MAFYHALNFPKRPIIAATERKDIHPIPLNNSFSETEAADQRPRNSPDGYDILAPTTLSPDNHLPLKVNTCCLPSLLDLTPYFSSINVINIILGL